MVGSILDGGNNQKQIVLKDKDLSWPQELIKKGSTHCGTENEPADGEACREHGYQDQAWNKDKKVKIL